MRPHLASCTAFQCGSASSSKSPPLSTRRCPDMLLATWLTTAASSPTLVQEHCTPLRLKHFSTVTPRPTLATKPSLQQLSVWNYLTTNLRQPDLSFRLRNDLYCVGWGVKLYSLTHPDLSYSLSRQLLKTALFGQWTKAQGEPPFKLCVGNPLTYLLLKSTNRYHHKTMCTVNVIIIIIIIIVAKIKVTLSHKNVAGALYTSHCRK